MDEFLEDLETGKIQFRDKWQFELKSDLFPLSYYRNNIINQEFYFFIPNSLQINEETYSNVQFYQAQTNLIRLKTPTFSFKELTDPNNAESPLVRIQLLSDYEQTKEHERMILDEVKLLGNIFHSAIRNRILEFMSDLDKISKHTDAQKFSKELNDFCDELELFRKQFEAIEKKCFLELSNAELTWTMAYIDEFVSLNINDYLTGLLNRLRMKLMDELGSSDKRICDIILKEKNYRNERFQEDNTFTQEPEHDEYVLYRKALLNKFVIDPLLLKISRSSVSHRYRYAIGAIPAGFAMFFYTILLFFFQEHGGINALLNSSQVLILLTVIVYVLRENIKEELKNISYQKAAKWFSDYTTDIYSPSGDSALGTLKESFSFIDEEKIPKEVMEIRNRHFHTVLESFKRPEKVIYYKKVVNIKKKPKTLEERFYGLNIIFRFDIHHFLDKAEDPLHTSLNLDPETLKLFKVQLPRVYHINIILKNTTAYPDGGTKVEWNKFRLVVDKSGIKRIEQV